MSVVGGERAVIAIDQGSSETSSPAASGPLRETPGPPPVDPRVTLAAERTLLAWIRTAVALMGFGFVVARFGMFLREMASVSGIPSERPLNASTIGVAVVAVGVLVVVWASVRHHRMMARLSRGEPLSPNPRGPVAIGIATGLGGIILTAVLLGALAR